MVAGLRQLRADPLAAARDGGRRLLLLSGTLAAAPWRSKYTHSHSSRPPLGGWLLWQVIVSRGVGAQAFHWLAPVLFTVGRGGCGCGWQRMGPGLKPTYPLLYGLFGGRRGRRRKNAMWNAVHHPHVFTLRALGKTLAGGGRQRLARPHVVRWAALALLRARSGGSPWGCGLVRILIGSWWMLALRTDRYGTPACDPGADGRRWSHVVPRQDWQRYAPRTHGCGCLASFVVSRDAAPITHSSRARGAADLARPVNPCSLLNETAGGAVLDGGRSPGFRFLEGRWSTTLARRLMFERSFAIRDGTFCGGSRDLRRTARSRLSLFMLLERDLPLSRDR